MNREEALKLLASYQEVARGHSKPELLLTIRERFPDDGSEAKAMRWLGFAQGMLVAEGIFTLTEVKQHAKNKEVREVVYIEVPKDLAKEAAFGEKSYASYFGGACIKALGGVKKDPHA